MILVKKETGAHNFNLRESVQSEKNILHELFQHFDENIT